MPAVAAVLAHTAGLATRTAATPERLGVDIVVARSRPHEEDKREERVEETLLGKHRKEGKGSAPHPAVRRSEGRYHWG